MLFDITLRFYLPAIIITWIQINNDIKDFFHYKSNTMININSVTIQSKIIGLFITCIEHFLRLKKTVLKLLSYMYILLICIVPTTHATNIPKLTMMTENWKPYNFEQNGVVKGISVDILALMLKKTGSTQSRSEIKIYPWVRAYTLVKEKANTVIFSTTRTKQREKMFKWVGPIFNVEFNLYALKKKNIKINSFKDLKKHKIGTLRGDVTEDLLVKYAGIQLSDLDRVYSNVANIKKLSAERVALIAESKNTLMTTYKEAGLNYDDFESVFILDKKNMYYAFHKETPDALIALFQKAFDEIKSEGKLDEIFHRYGK